MKKKHISLLITYLTLIAVVIITILPIVYTFAASFKTNMEILTNSGNIFSKNPTWSNYIAAWTSPDFQIGRQVMNSMLYCACSVIIQIIIAPMAGYAFSKGEFPLKNAIFYSFTALMFVKLGGISIWATFDVLNLFHLPRNLYSLILLNLFAVPIVQIYLVRGFINTLPHSIIEAAKIDGCSFFGTFRMIVFPLLKPIIATIAILAFQGSWNDYIMPTIFTVTKPEQRTLIVGLMSLKNSSGAATSWNLMLAGSVIAIVPVLIAYAFANQYFVKGIAAGAEKG